LALPDAHPDGLSPEKFREVFTDDKPVIFNFHGYPSAVHQLIHRRPRQERFHVRGYAEEGTTTTPFDLLAMNGVDRFQLAIDALSRADISVAEMVRGMSGEFAVRNVHGAREAIDKFSRRREDLRRTVRERGDDPDEIKNWVWPSGETVAV
jgi:xylulose-5-phosphate/fructose-6-phosphate phosphoketolase